MIRNFCVHSWQQQVRLLLVISPPHHSQKPSGTYRGRRNVTFSAPYKRDASLRLISRLRSFIIIHPHSIRESSFQGQNLIYHLEHNSTKQNSLVLVNASYPTRVIYRTGIGTFMIVVAGILKKSCNFTDLASAGNQYPILFGFVPII